MTQTVDVDNKLAEYLEVYNGVLLSELSLDQANRLFQKIGNDFKLGELTLDEMSVFGFKFFHEVAKKYSDSDLFKVSLSVSELNFAVRNEAVYVNIQMYLEDLDEFLRKFRNLSVNL